MKTPNPLEQFLSDSSVNAIYENTWKRIRISIFHYLPDEKVAKKVIEHFSLSNTHYTLYSRLHFKSISDEIFSDVGCARKLEEFICILKHIYSIYGSE